MSHEISVVEVDGEIFSEALYANKPAWHGLGTIFDKDGADAPDSETAIKAAHLDWKVEAQPIYLKGDIEIENQFSTVRTDINRSLGIVSKRYHIVQNSEAFSFVDQLLQDGVLRYESAMALKGGRKVVLLARMPEVDEVTDEDHQLRYVLLSNSHDGSSALTMMPTSVRVVCANTLALAWSIDGEKSYNIRHTASLTEKVKKAIEYISQFNEKFTLFRDKARKLATTNMSQIDMEQYLNTLFPLPPKTIKGDDKLKESKRRDNKLDKIRVLMKNNRNNMASIRGTWWAGFNSISEYVDHHATYKQTKTSNKLENNFISSTEGIGAELKTFAFDKAMEMAGI